MFLYLLSITTSQKINNKKYINNKSPGIPKIPTTITVYKLIGIYISIPTAIVLKINKINIPRKKDLNIETIFFKEKHLKKYYEIKFNLKPLSYYLKLIQE